jgi:hypothetical protein
VQGPCCCVPQRDAEHAREGGRGPGAAPVATAAAAAAALSNACTIPDDRPLYPCHWHMQGKTVSVNYATSPGSASAPDDYASTGGTLTFAAGETTKTVSVDVVGDTLVEPNETVDLVLSGPVNATLAGATAAAMITNDDVRGGCGAEGRRSLPSWPPSCAALALALAAAP